MLCDMPDGSMLLWVTSITSPTRVRMRGPGTFPLNVHASYLKRLVMAIVLTLLFSSTFTSALPLRSSGGGTPGAASKMAFSTGSLTSANDDGSVDGAAANAAVVTPNVAAMADRFAYPPTAANRTP